MTIENAIKNKVDTINEILGDEIVSVDYENDYIDVNYNDGGGYTVVCDDEDDVYNSLLMMLEGMTILANVRREHDDKRTT